MAVLPLSTASPRVTITAVVDILVVAFLIYQFIMIVRGRRAAHILIGLGVLAGLYVVAVWARLDLLRSILAYLAPYTAIGMIVMFQSEIRSLLAGIGRRRWGSFHNQLRSREFAAEILLATQQLAQDRTGALIVIERDIGLRTFIESGVNLDALLSRDLLLSIFQKGGALHDGAAIVQGDRLAAAACFLPLSTSPVALRTLGTRHRAAIGITEETDCLALVVSEETGQISIALFGEISTSLSLEQVADRLNGHFVRRLPQLASPPRPMPVEQVQEAKK